jgi:hypothetical protein
LFITDRCDFPEQPGPSPARAAAAMLHSHKQWGASYDKNKQARQAKQTAADMQLYRLSMLGAAAGGGGAGSASAWRRRRAVTSSSK